MSGALVLNKLPMKGKVGIDRMMRVVLRYASGGNGGDGAWNRVLQQLKLKLG